MAEYDEIMMQAFRDELQKLAHLIPPTPGIEKEAFLGAALKGLRGAASRPANPFKGGPGVFQSFGKDLMAGGKMLSSPQLTGVGRFTEAGVGRRVAGEVAQTAGHHYAHKSTLGNLVNPLGGALGGISGGLASAAGKETARAGQALGGRVGGALQGAGRGLQKAAPAAGLVGEVAGVAGLGTLAHVPLSAQGLVGGKAMALGIPGVENALSSAGHYAAHAAHDAVGTAGQAIGNKARQAVGLMRKPVAPPKTGYTMPPPPMAAGAH